MKNFLNQLAGACALSLTLLCVAPGVSAALVDFNSTGLTDNTNLPLTFGGFDWTQPSGTAWRIENDDDPFVGMSGAGNDDGWAKGFTDGSFAKITRLDNTNPANNETFAFNSMWLGTRFTDTGDVDNRWLSSIDIQFTDITLGQTVLKGFDLTGNQWNQLTAATVMANGVQSGNASSSGLRADLTLLKSIKFIGSSASRGDRSGRFGLDNFTIVTPIPASLPLFLSAMGVLGFMGWRKHRV